MSLCSWLQGCSVAQSYTIFASCLPYVCSAIKTLLVEDEREKCGKGLRAAGAGHRDKLYCPLAFECKVSIIKSLTL